MVQLLDAKTGETIGKQIDVKGTISVVAFRPDGTTFTAAGNEKIGREYFLDGNLRGQSKPMKAPIRAMAYGPDNSVVIGGIDRAVLHAGMFFGEISVLLDQPVGASVVSRTPLRCAHIDRADLIPFLLDHPTVTLRLLQAEARRVDDANRWML